MTDQRKADLDVVGATEAWPSSWAYIDSDERIGQDLVALIREFMFDLEQKGLGVRTRRRHLNNLWLLGGEIVRLIQTDQLMKRRSALSALAAATDLGEAVLIPNLTESEQASVDQTARRLNRFLRSKADTPDGNAATRQREDRSEDVEISRSTVGRRLRPTSILSDDEIGAVRDEVTRILPGLPMVALVLGLDLEQSVRLQSLSAKCRERREGLGFSIREVAARLRVAQYRIRAIEAGRMRELDPQVVMNYTKLLGLDSWLTRWKRSNRSLARELGLSR